MAIPIHKEANGLIMNTVGKSGTARRSKSVVEELEQCMPDGNFQKIPLSSDRKMNSLCPSHSIMPKFSVNSTEAEIFFRDIILPLLINRKWVYHPIQKQFSLKCVASILHLSKVSIMNKITMIKQNQKKGETFGLSGRQLEEWISVLLEEDLLICKIHRQIALSAMISSTLEDCSKDSPDLKSSKIEKQPLFISVKNRLPRYLPNTTQEILAFNELGSHLPAKVIDKLNSASSPQDEKSMIQVNVFEDPNDPSSIILHAKGTEDLVEQVKTLVTKLIKNSIARHNLKVLVTNKSSLELELLIDISPEFNATLVKPTGSNENGGLWIERIQRESQFYKVLGKATERGGALMKLDGKKVCKLADKNKVIKEARNKFEKNGVEGKNLITATICISKDADLSSLNARRINSVRRRDGTVVRGKWNSHLPRKNNDPHNQGRGNSLKRHAPKSIDKSILKRSKIDASSVVKTRTKLKVDKKIEMNQLSNPLRRSNSLLGTNDRISDSSISKNGNLPKTGEYFVIFKPAASPLGFFCVTKKPYGWDLKDRCVITSISPLLHSQEPQIMEDTAVIACAIVSKGNETKVEISTHIQLKEKYNTVKIRRDATKLKIFFKNPNNHKDSSIHDSKIDWTDTGAWKGISKIDGWAGGSSQAQGRDDLSAKQIHLKKRETDEEKSKETIRDVMRRKISNNAKYSASKISSTLPTEAGKVSQQYASSPAISNLSSLHQSAQSKNNFPAKTPKESSLGEQDILCRKSLSKQILLHSNNQKPKIKSILRRKPSFDRSKASDSSKNIDRSKGMKWVKRQVSFCKKLTDTRIFSKIVDEGATNVDNGNDVSSATDVVAVAMLSESRIPDSFVQKNITTLQQLNDNLIDAVKNESIENMIKCFKAGATPPSQTNTKPVNEAKNQMLLLVDEVSRTSDKTIIDQLTTKIEVYKDKEVILKIYAQAAYAIDLARTLEDSVILAVSPLKATSLKLTKLANDSTSAHFLYCDVKIDGMLKSPSMPMIPFSESADWTKVQDCPSYKASFNKVIDSKYRKEREVQIDLIKGTKSLIETCLPLVSCKVSLEKINDVLESEQGNILSCPYESTKYLYGGEIDIRIERNAGNLQRKRKEIAELITLTLDWIKNLQSKTSCSSQPIIDGNIYFTSCESISLLHAAVYTCNPDLICQIIDLKADPLHKSGVGTPIDLTMNLIDKARLQQNGLTENLRKIHTYLSSKVMNDSKHNRCNTEQTNEINIPCFPKLNESLNQTKSVNTVSYKGVDTFNEDRDFFPEGKRKLLEGSALERSVSSRIKVRKVSHGDTSYYGPQDPSHGSRSTISESVLLNENSQSHLI